MRWITTSFITGVRERVGGFTPRGPGGHTLTLDDIKKAMLAALGDMGAEKYPVVQLKVSCANDIEDLWYLRGDLMAVLSAFSGELAAKRQINEISNMFHGMLPRGLISRPSPLGDSH
jgi:hypothetical protein